MYICIYIYIYIYITILINQVISKFLIFSAKKVESYFYTVTYN